jgi:hypothetical protein
MPDGIIRLGASSFPHSCSANAFLRFCCASATRFIASTGTLNSRLQQVQTATAGTVPIHLVTRRLRFAINKLCHKLPRLCRRGAGLWFLNDGGAGHQILHTDNYREQNESGPQADARALHGARLILHRR